MRLDDLSRGEAVLPQVLPKTYLELDPLRMRVLKIAPQYVAPTARVFDQPVVVAGAGLERTDNREPHEWICREDSGCNCISHGSGLIQPAKGLNTFQEFLIRS